ncbi:protein export chaperone SatS [Mycolicibacterium diernhoferi]|uniref:Primosomal protein n=1 Tax=Mycolicibacterium diernhoferi TaxID=1801 RepID=A0A1Q4HFC3_9MYCO|nr:primosomal protein [Mycolicibacterium diernhoferi]OJZ66185.1 primosomal protein [Mycolicibacterium diernhoferi]OPE48569.1 primosomal protein [Mycolicibacterium diernhoferi]PEG51202.1 primosomal protein [Mycolicibacterium diernhoferi]QYL24095.1 primosomal protein [Mycolicibacterium diernhoferi]
MAADIVPVRIGLTNGDLYTLWAPRWRDAGDEWEAFLGKDEDIFAFESVADLAAFVRTDSDNDLADHPAWEKLTEANAHRFDPAEDQRHDLIGVPELVAEKPTEESVKTLRGALGIVSAIGSVCDLPTITKMFNGNPVLGTIGGGLEAFSGRAGRKRWAEIEAVIGRAWDGVIDTLDELVSTPQVPKAESEKAEAELAEPAPEFDDIVTDDEVLIEGEVDTEEEVDALQAEAERQVLGGDKDFWAQVGIDPIRVMTSSGTLYTLRCYVGDDPRFLGRNGRISVFNSERALARYLADEHESDLSGFSTYEIIRTAATDGSLRVEVTEENIYVLSGLVDDIADGPEAVDREQLDLALEFLRDVGDYAEDPIVSKTLAADQPLGAFVDYVLDPKKPKPKGSTLEAVDQFEELERFVESRLRHE